MRRNDDALDALMRRVTKRPDGCWIREGAAVRGYPVVKIAGRQHRAARLAFTLLVGPITDGMTIDHLCRETRCVNPEHLEPVTNAENARRARAARAPTHCPQGHPYDEANRVIYDGRLHCRACRKARNAAQAEYRRDWKRRKRAAERQPPG